MVTLALMWFINLFAVVITYLAANVDASSFCSGYYCRECCCDRSVGCCSCDSILAWWAWFLLVMAIIVIIAIAAGVGAWRRRLYLQRIGTAIPVRIRATVALVDTVNAGYSGCYGLPSVDDRNPPPYSKLSEPCNTQFAWSGYPDHPHCVLDKTDEVHT